MPPAREGGYAMHRLRFTKGMQGKRSVCIARLAGCLAVIFIVGGLPSAAQDREQRISQFREYHEQRLERPTVQRDPVQPVTEETLRPQLSFSMPDFQSVEVAPAPQQRVSSADYVTAPDFKPIESGNYQTLQGAELTPISAWASVPRASASGSDAYRALETVGGNYVQDCASSLLLPTFVQRPKAFSDMAKAYRNGPGETLHERYDFTFGALRPLGGLAIPAGGMQIDFLRQIHEGLHTKAIQHLQQVEIPNPSGSGPTPVYDPEPVNQLFSDRQVQIQRDAAGNVTNYTVTENIHGGRIDAQGNFIPLEDINRSSSADTSSGEAEKPIDLGGLRTLHDPMSYQPPVAAQLPPGGSKPPDLPLPLSGRVRWEDYSPPPQWQPGPDPP